MSSFQRESFNGLTNSHCMTRSTDRLTPHHLASKPAGIKGKACEKGKTQAECAVRIKNPGNCAAAIAHKPRAFAMRLRSRNNGARQTRVFPVAESVDSGRGRSQKTFEQCGQDLRDLSHERRSRSSLPQCLPLTTRHRRQEPATRS